MRSPKNALLHELIGLDCTVVRSRNSAQIGISGKIIDETQKTIVLETAHGVKRFAKSDIFIHVKIDDKLVELSGKYLVSRPEDRIKRKFKKW